MQSARPNEVLSLSGKLASQLKKRSQDTCEEVKQITKQAKEELPRLVVIPKVWCITVASVIFSLLFLIAVQFAGLVEIQYALSRSDYELEELRHQKAEMALHIEQLSSLERIETEAKQLGMEYPTNMQVVRIVGADTTSVAATASHQTGAYGN